MWDMIMIIMILLTMNLIMILLIIRPRCDWSIFSYISLLLIFINTSNQITLVLASLAPGNFSSNSYKWEVWPGLLAIMMWWQIPLAISLMRNWQSSIFYSNITLMTSNSPFTIGSSAYWVLNNQMWISTRIIIDVVMLLTIMMLMIMMIMIMIIVMFNKGKDAHSGRGDSNLVWRRSWWIKLTFLSN